MAKSINSLLAKKGWTGEEVGKALVASLLNDIRNQGKGEYEPLFSQADFDEMESSLRTDKDFLAYGVYRDIYSSIVDTFNRGQGLYQQFYNGYYRYLMKLRGAMEADDALADIDRHPLIMTAYQYERAKAETLTWQRGLKTSFFSLIFTVLSACISALEDNRADEVPATILKAIEATKKEPATNKRILSYYNEDMGEGYYQLPDGRRSDKITSEEWGKALQDLFLETHKLTINGQPASAEETMRHYNRESLVAGYELFFKGEDAIREAFKEKTGRELEGDATEILKELEEIIGGDGGSITSPLRNDLYTLYADETPTEWHYYEAPPEGLTKYDIISQLLDRYSGSAEGDIPKKDQLKEFKRDYPALYKALDAYIRETVPTARNIKPAQFYRDLLSWGELVDSNIMGYKAGFVVSAFEIISYLQENGACKFADAKRATKKGIAVLMDPMSWQIDKNGNYKDDPNPLDRLESIDALAESERERGSLDELRNNLFIPALRYLYGFNAVIELVGEAYDINGIEVAKFDTSLFESQLRGFNGLLYSFYFSVYGDKAEKARKRELIKDLFQPVDTEAQKPTAEALAKVKAELVKGGISSTARKTLKTLTAL